MAITRKQTHDYRLESFRVWIEDNDPHSLYFQVSQIPEVLTAGKNAFLINGSPNLINSTEVLVELKDAFGKVVFSQPIKNYTEGLARVISIEVYSDTAAGVGTLTLLGQISKNVDGLQPPDEFIGAYNVRWQRRVVISPTLGNDSTIRLFKLPTADVKEILTPYRDAEQSIETISGSGDIVLTGTSLHHILQPGIPIPNRYVFSSNNPIFSKQMEGGVFSTTINNLLYTASIDNVINDRLIEVNPGIFSDDQFISTTVTDFTLSFTGSMQYTPTQFTRSYADISIRNMTTFTGDIYRVKVYVSEIGAPNDPELIGDVKVHSPELMVTHAFVNRDHKLRTGYFTDNAMVKSLWTAGLIDSMSLYNPS
jgi:hypothetical protein